MKLSDAAEMSDNDFHRTVGHGGGGRHVGGPEPGAASTAAYTEVVTTWADMTPEQKAEQAEINRRGLQLVREAVDRLGSKFSMPGDDGRRAPVQRIEDPGQGDRVRRQMEELRRNGLYDGPVTP